MSGTMNALAGSGAAPVATVLGGTWNPSAKSGNFALSGGNLIATGSTDAYKSVYGTATISGLKKFTVAFNSFNVSDGAVGISNTPVNYDSFVGADTHSIGLIQDGRVLYNNSTIATVSAWGGAGSVVVEVNTATTQIRFTVNGGTPTAWYTYSVTGAITPIASSYWDSATCTYS